MADVFNPLPISVGAPYKPADRLDAIICPVDPASIPRTLTMNCYAGTEALTDELLRDWSEHADVHLRRWLGGGRNR